MIQCKIKIPYNPKVRYEDQESFAWVDTVWEDTANINMLGRQYQTEFRKIKITEIMK